MLTVDLDKLNIQDGSTVLDLGCGKGRHLHRLYYYKKCHVVGLDLSLNELKTTYQGFEKYPDLNEKEERMREFLNDPRLNTVSLNLDYKKITDPESVEDDYKGLIKFLKEKFND